MTAEGKIRVRFAPSPTGFLHIGGARTALFNWLFARRHGGTFILRIEDTDEVRSTEDSVSAILKSMRWLGLDWDEGPAHEDIRGGGDAGPYFQMERRELYTRHAEQLLAEGKAYRCYCVKEEIEEAKRAAGKQHFRCARCPGLDEAGEKALEAEGRRSAVRFRIPEEGSTTFRDMVRGEVTKENKELQDLVIMKSTGGPTYSFACVVDDHLMGMSHVIRGADHINNTTYQERMYRAFGWEPPRFAHVSLLHGPDGKKLSKRVAATSVEEYRDGGYLPEAIRNYLALLGWSTSDSQQFFERAELIEKFDLSGCQKSPAVYDMVKLESMNGDYLRRMSPEEILEGALPFLKGAGLADEPRDKLLTATAMEREKFRLLSDVPKRIDFFFKDVEYQEKAVNKVLRKEGAAGVLEGLESLLSDVEPFAETNLEEKIRAFCAERDLKTGKVFHPIRVAVSGRTEGPTLFGMLELLGKEKVLSRIRAARRLIGAQ